jgi:hypothetical protein
MVGLKQWTSSRISWIFLSLERVPWAEKILLIKLFTLVKVVCTLAVELS